MVSWFSLISIQNVLKLDCSIILFRVEVRKLSDDNDSYVNAYAYDYAENILVNVAKGHLRHMVKKLKGVPKSAYLAELSSDCGNHILIT